MKDIKAVVKKFMDERDWNDQPPSDIAKSIIIEAAELLEHFQWTSYFADEVINKPELKKEVVKELADVFIYAIEMAIVLDVDIYDIVHEKILQASKKYPVGVVNGKGSAQKYKEIKKKYRAAANS